MDHTVQWSDPLYSNFNFRNMKWHAKKWTFKIQLLPALPNPADAPAQNQVAQHASSSTNYSVSISYQGWDLLSKKGNAVVLSALLLLMEIPVGNTQRATFLNQPKTEEKNYLWPNLMSGAESQYALWDQIFYIRNTSLLKFAVLQTVRWIRKSSFVAHFFLKFNLVNDCKVIYILLLKCELQRVNT